MTPILLRSHGFRICEKKSSSHHGLLGTLTAENHPEVWRSYLCHLRFCGQGVALVGRVRRASLKLTGEIRCGHPRVSKGFLLGLGALHMMNGGIYPRPRKNMT